MGRKPGRNPPRHNAYNPSASRTVRKAPMVRIPTNSSVHGTEIPWIPEVDRPRDRWEPEWVLRRDSSLVGDRVCMEEFAAHGVPPGDEWLTNNCSDDVILERAAYIGAQVAIFNRTLFKRLRNPGVPTNEARGGIEAERRSVPDGYPDLKKAYLDLSAQYDQVCMASIRKDEAFLEEKERIYAQQDIYSAELREEYDRQLNQKSLDYNRHMETYNEELFKRLQSENALRAELEKLKRLVEPEAIPDGDLSRKSAITARAVKEYKESDKFRADVQLGVETYKKSRHFKVDVEESLEEYKKSEAFARDIAEGVELYKRSKAFEIDVAEGSSAYAPYVCATLSRKLKPFLEGFDPETFEFFPDFSSLSDEEVRTWRGIMTRGVPDDSGGGSDVS